MLEDIDNQLVQMGLDEAKQQEMLQIVLDKISVPFKLIGFAGIGLFSIVKAIGKQFTGKEDPLIAELRKDVNNALVKYIDTDLKAARNSLTAT